MSEAHTADYKAIGVGMAIAAGIVMSCWGDDVIAGEILSAGNLTTLKDMREAGVDRYDVRLCLPVLKRFRDRARAALSASEQP